MTFSTLAGMAGGGMQTPGIMGVGKFYLTSQKFISADGGLKRIVWMSSNLKESMAAPSRRSASARATPTCSTRSPTRPMATTVEELLPFLEEKGHPALTMDPLF